MMMRSFVTSLSCRSLSGKRSQKRLLNYMVAVDGSNESMDAVNRCMRLAREEDKVTLLHVYEPVNPKIEAEYQAKERSSLEDLLKEKVQTDKEYELKFKSGPPPFTVCSEVKANEIDYLYIGDRGLGGLKRKIIGSLANYCVHYAPCSVIIVKDKKRADRDFAKIADDENERPVINFP